MEKEDKKDPIEKKYREGATYSQEKGPPLLGLLVCRRHGAFFGFFNRLAAACTPLGPCEAKGKKKEIRKDKRGPLVGRPLTGLQQEEEEQEEKPKANEILFTLFFLSSLGSAVPALERNKGPLLFRSNAKTKNDFSFFYFYFLNPSLAVVFAPFFFLSNTNVHTVSETG